jgi:hypothetical protein
MLAMTDVLSTLLHTVHIVRQILEPLITYININYIKIYKQDLDLQVVTD